ncbi:phosphotransferase family protein [Amycolatopsis sp. lyj-346]|uniref:phosphotransferase family protein n=1 Tax=Amycolatopsis sp. lyj-346 TaxID=2789289 RepID=UPI0039792E9A
MERYSWAALPDAVRDAVQRHVGPATAVREVERGQNCSIALVVHGGQGDVFVKGVRGVSPQMRWLRNEVAAGGLAPGVAPDVRFCADVDAEDRWFVAGFEFVHGRPAELSPGSTDLELVAATVTGLGEFPGGVAPSLSERWNVSDWWLRWAALTPDPATGWDLDLLTEWCHAVPGLVYGDSLLHTDLHEHQFVIDDAGSVRVLDWGRPASGARWVDTAFLVVRLIAAGHEPRAAEAWAETVAGWPPRSDGAVTAFACYVAGLWSYRAVTTPFPGATRLSEAAQSYLRYRLVEQPRLG